jgi:transposase
MKRLVIHKAKQAMGIIQDEIQSTDETRYQHRLHCILLIADGKTCAEVSSLFKDGLRTVQYWTKRFNEDGIDGLRDNVKPGRKARLFDKDKVTLSQDLRRPPSDFGYSQNLWDGKLLSHHLKQKFDVELKIRRCQSLFHEFYFRRRKPRLLLPRQIKRPKRHIKKLKELANSDDIEL